MCQTVPNTSLTEVTLMMSAVGDACCTLMRIDSQQGNSPTEGRLAGRVPHCRVPVPILPCPDGRAIHSLLLLETATKLTNNLRHLQEC